MIYRNSEYYPRLSLLLFALLSLPNVIYMQQVNVGISGEVRDASTGKELSWANIAIVGTNMGAATNEDGSYYISDF